MDKGRISAKTRLKEFAIDYIVIVAYLVLLFAVAGTFYMVAFGEIPAFSQRQSQLIATGASVMPIVIVFSLMDYQAPFGTFGKRKAGLRVSYKTRAYWRSLVRNVVKFLPWQLAHMGVIGGMYSNFASPLAMAALYVSLGLLALLLGMVLFRKDGRHLGDMLAGTRVVSAQSPTLSATKS